MKWTGLDYEQAVRLDQDRQKWRTIASNTRQRGRKLIMVMKLARRAWNDEFRIAAFC